jgi:hypothetical protein
VVLGLVEMVGKKGDEKTINLAAAASMESIRTVISCHRQPAWAAAFLSLTAPACLEGYPAACASRQDKQYL